MCGIIIHYIHLYIYHVFLIILLTVSTTLLFFSWSLYSYFVQEVNEIW